jgi:hypothetical protein
MASTVHCPHPLLAPLWHAHRHTFVVVCCLCCRLCLLPHNYSVPLSTRSLPQFLPPSQWSLLLSLFDTKLHARLVD